MTGWPGRTFVSSVSFGLASTQTWSDGDQIEGGHRGLQVFAGRDRGHVRHDARERRLHDRVVELARGFVALRHGIEITRMLLDRDIGIAVEVGGDRGELLVERGELLLRVLQIPARGVEGLLRRDVLGREILLTMEFAIVVVDIDLRLLDLRLHVPVVRLERIEIVTHDPDLRGGALQREPEREIVEAEQDLALRRRAGCC